MNGREEILSRIRRALQVPAPKPGHQDLDRDGSIHSPAENNAKTDAQPRDEASPAFDPNLLLTVHIAGVTQEPNVHVSWVTVEKVRNHLAGA